MAKKTQKKKRAQAEGNIQTDLPPGVKLLRTLEGQDSIVSLAFNPRGDVLASGGFATQVKLWEARTGKLLFSLKSSAFALALVFDPRGRMLASSYENAIQLWDAHSGHRGAHLKVTSTA